MQHFRFNNFFSGLSRQVLVWFMLIALVPIGVVSWVSFDRAQKALFEVTERYLVDVAVMQAQHIRSNFERLIVDLNNEAEQESNSHFLELLVEDFRGSGQDVHAYTRSFRWAILADEHTADLRTFWNAYGYHDILMVDLEGNVLFSFSQENDIGENLLTGSLANTRLAQAAEQALESGQTKFSDLERYAASGNQVAGFILSPLLDSIGEKIGLIVFQLSGDQLRQLEGNAPRFGNTGRRYLIGEDLKLRTSGALDEGRYSVLENKVRTENSQKWLKQHHNSKEVVHQIQQQAQLYQGPHGVPVVGVHTTLDFADVHWGLIVEIDAAEALAASNELGELIIMLIAMTAVLVLLIALPVTRSIVSPVVGISRALSLVGQGDLQQLQTRAKHELGLLVHGFNEMILNLQVSEQKSSNQYWKQEGANQLMDKMQGDQALTDLARNTITFLCHYLDAKIGAFYVVQGGHIKLSGSYAFRARKGFHNDFIMGEGMVGQAALEKQTLLFTDVPQDYFAAGSGLGEIVPDTIMVMPLLWNHKVVALLELGTMLQLNILQEQFLESMAPAIAVAVETSLSRDRTQELLLKTQEQSEKLQVREEKLRESNVSLESQAQDLRHSEERLRSSQVELEEKNEKMQVQQEELRVANEDLERKAGDLKQSRDQVGTKNRELEYAQQKLEERAMELSASSQYKSEFLANMSHELRTPLNSLLILSRLLADNKGGNLEAQQVEYAQTIYDSGSDLLNLINDILDLSKIESGKMELHIETIQLKDFVAGVQRKFLPVAENKQIHFEVDTEGAPQFWRSDMQKLEQVIKNLLSNALKFTTEGRVQLRISSVPAGQSLNASGLVPEQAIAFSVIDSGIGISAEKLGLIFDAFQQADGSTSRKYGGTGLGLSISRELTLILGGEIQIESQEGEGSCFTLYLPRELEQKESMKEEALKKELMQEERQSVDSAASRGGVEKLGRADVGIEAGVSPITSATFELDDDRSKLSPGDRSVLIIEDDSRFAAILADIARERGFKVLIAGDGESGLYLADYYQPSGIVLDIGLPGMDGWQVMDRLKDESNTRHIPVHFMSGNEQPEDALKHGAVGFLTKPVSIEQIESALGRIEHIIDRPVKRLLLVEDNLTQLQSIRELIGDDDVETSSAQSGEEALALLKADAFDCIVLDLGLPDIDGFELLETIRKQGNLEYIPVVIYTGRDLDAKERAILDRYAQSVIVKDVRSPERLLDDTTLFLHRVESKLSEEHQRTIRMLHDRESLFEGRKVLVVDDDMRNVFALSAALQEKQMEVLVANDGYEALDQLEQHPDTAIVLMDIMMPKMDGYEAMQKIREQTQFTALPIVALTAKAMKGDRKACIEAGANDYLAKPIETEKMLSMMRVWLYR